jgi:hypothetical protein
MKAVQIGRKEYDVNSQRLDLPYNKFKTLPPQIGELVNLQELCLRNNNLKSLPPQIGKLVNLQRLYLYDNKFKTLPPQIGKLVNLQKLDLDCNILESLPPEIGQLVNLQGLYLYDNKFKTLPPQIGELVNLTSFYCNVPEGFTPDNKVTFVSKGETPRVFILKSNNRVVCGCFEGTISEFNDSVIKKYGNMDNYCPEFTQFIKN